jgi:hypothetical protein
MAYKLLEYGDMLEVGDIIISDNILGKRNYVITRVTKTSALSKRPNDGFENKWQRVCQWDMTKPNQDWNTTSYSVYREVSDVE